MVPGLLVASFDQSEQRLEALSLFLLGSILTHGWLGQCPILNSNVAPGGSRPVHSATLLASWISARIKSISEHMFGRKKAETHNDNAVTHAINF